MPGTIYETAEAVTAASGKGIAVRCDHGDDAQVAALFERIEADGAGLDILVNNAAAIYDELTEPGTFWEKPLKLADIIDVGIRSTYVASWHAARLLMDRDKALILANRAAMRGSREGRELAAAIRREAGDEPPAGVSRAKRARGSPRPAVAVDARTGAGR